ncbi:MAG: hypothetical protein AAFX95_26625 [Cyanobacteria bacterium J06639_16]
MGLYRNHDMLEEGPRIQWFAWIKMVIALLVVGYFVAQIRGRMANDPNLRLDEGEEVSQVLPTEL